MTALLINASDRHNTVHMYTHTQTDNGLSRRLLYLKYSTPILKEAQMMVLAEVQAPGIPPQTLANHEI